MAKKAAAKKTTKKAAPAPRRSGAPRVSMASTAYELIEDGKSNAEVLAALKKAFPGKLPADGSHDYYPSWYRSHLVQQGKITKEFAAEHSGERINGGHLPGKKSKKVVAETPKRRRSKRDEEPEEQEEEETEEESEETGATEEGGTVEDPQPEA